MGLFLFKDKPWVLIIISTHNLLVRVVEMVEYYHGMVLRLTQYVQQETTVPLVQKLVC